MGSSRIVTGLVAAAAFMVFGGLPSEAREPHGWTLVDLGTLGGPGSYGAAVNNGGVVVGCADVDVTSAHAFVYRDGVMKDLGTATDSATGHSCALAVNDHGVAAGRSASGDLVTWQGNTVTRLGIQGNVGGINNAGVVVGSYTQGAATRAFKYSNGSVTSLPGESASAINSHGNIVGTAGGHAVVFQDNAIRDLGTLGGNGSVGRGINDHGDVVGLATDANGQALSFQYERAMMALPAPGYSIAVAINDRGQVVGSVEGRYGYLIDNGTFVRLDTLSEVAAKGWRRMEPTGINDRGWIVGTGTNADGNLRAFLLIPATERVAIRLATETSYRAKPLSPR